MLCHDKLRLQGRSRVFCRATTRFWQLLQQGRALNSTLKALSIVLLAFQWCGSGSASAHPGHEHVLTKEEALSRAATVVLSLVDKHKKIAGEILDDSWIMAADSATCEGTPDFYRIAVNNRQAGKTLYLLLTSTGKYLRANFDGHFADLTFSPYPLYSC